nr:YitT family protein [Caldalkalibacillus salinus]
MVMAFGIVLMIKADLGSAPWDVLHIGLTLQMGLTIGTWSIIVGIFIILLTTLLTKERPQLGAILNMLFVGMFIDLFVYLLAWFEPEGIIIQLITLVLGMLIMGYGIGLYIAPNCGAGPRDSLMLALTQLTSWKVQYVRGAMEVVVLAIGWLLGGPVFIGTLLFCFGIGSIVGVTLPHCQKMVDKLLQSLDHDVVATGKNDHSHGTSV